MRIPPQLLLILLFALVGCPDGGDDDDVSGDDDATSDDDDGWIPDDDDITADDDTGDDDDDSDCAVPVDFQEIVQSEAYIDDGKLTWADCETIAVLMLQSQAELELAYQELLPSVPAGEIVTSVDFGTNMALLSYAEEGCPWDGNTLVVNSVCLEENVVVVDETLINPEMGIEMAAKVYNLTQIPAGEYDWVNLVLTVEYLGKSTSRRQRALSSPLRPR